MTLTLWCGFHASDHLKCWYCSTDPNWSAFGEALSFEEFSSPVAFAFHQSQQNLVDLPIQFRNRIFTLRYRLVRDDPTSGSAFELDENPLKTMTVFSEYLLSSAKLSEALQLRVMHIELGQSPGEFCFALEFPTLHCIGDLARLLGLLRAGLEMLACTRGFQALDVTWQNIHIDKNLLSNLRELLC